MFWDKISVVWDMYVCTSWYEDLLFVWLHLGSWEVNERFELKLLCVERANKVCNA